MENDQKLQVLARIAGKLNKAGVTWAVGGSLLLYFKKITDTFKDIDIVLLEEDAQTVKTILLEMGTMEPLKRSSQYKTKAFFEFTIDAVDVDVLAGFVIVKDGIEHDCALRKADIQEYIEVHNEHIPLHAVEVWRKYYTLMDKSDKVSMIDENSNRK